jgi:hypothetical protein
MTRMLKLASLLGIASLTLWAGANRPVMAYPLCDGVHGTYCVTVGSKTPCTTSDGFTSSCTCTSGHFWRCLL